MTYKDGEKEREAQVFPESIDSLNGGHEIVDVVWTKWGPVIYREGRYGLVAVWTSFQTKNELLAARKLFSARDMKECLQAFDDWAVPVQNFICADADHIGILHAGFVPKREVGEGRFIEKAGDSKYNLRTPIDAKLRLERVDPPEGFLRSANERVADETYPNYMGWNYEEPFRGMRIRNLLTAQDKFSGEDLIRIQNDDFDAQADLALPYMLKALNQNGLSGEQRQAVAALEKWDRHAKWDRVEPSLYKTWFSTIKHEIFDDEYKVTERKEFLPKDIRTIWLLKRVSENPNDSDSQWVDDKKTPAKEDLQAIVTRAFNIAWKKLSDKFGKDPSRWIWKRAINTRIPHLAKIPGFGSGQLEMNGAGESIRGNRGWHGAVYRTVVELGSHPRAWMQTPGGTTGDPFSKDFERNTKDWAAGKMRQVKYYKDAQEARADGAEMIEFTPGEN